jgi:hypothetical protein
MTGTRATNALTTCDSSPASQRESTFMTPDCTAAWPYFVAATGHDHVESSCAEATHAVAKATLDFFIDVACAQCTASDLIPAGAQSITSDFMRPAAAACSESDLSPISLEGVFLACG